MNMRRFTLRLANGKERSFDTGPMILDWLNRQIKLRHQVQQKHSRSISANQPQQFRKIQQADNSPLKRYTYWHRDQA